MFLLLDTISLVVHIKCLFLITYLNVTYKYECYSSNVVFFRLQVKADPESEIIEKLTNRTNEKQLKDAKSMNK